MHDHGMGRLTQAERRDKTRAKLLAAATELFSQHGYHRTQVMDIVTTAHVSAGTFYRYFDDKQGNFVAIAEERGMVQFLEHHFERIVQRSALYRALDNSGVVDQRHDHAAVMRKRAVKALAEQLGRNGAKDTDDLESLARMIMGVMSALRHAMIETGKPTPAQAARLVTRFLQGGMAAYTTRSPRYPGLFSDEWGEALEREART